MAPAVANPYAAQPQQGGYSAPRGAVPPPPSGELQRRLTDALHASAIPHSQFDAAPEQVEQPRPQRDSWMAPGNVLVEDGLENFPPLAGNALLRTPPLPHEGPTSSQGPYFDPQPPAEIPRTSRRIPSIEEFPPQAQKEWNAHRGTYGERQEEPRKPGIFGRLVGMARKPADAKTSSRQNIAAVSETDEDGTPLPIFVGRERR